MKCFICDIFDSEENLHNVSTFVVDSRIRHLATILQDTKLLAKLSCGDLVAQETKYHDKCLAALYNRERKLNSFTENRNNNEKIVNGIVLAEVMNYIKKQGIRQM